MRPLSIRRLLAVEWDTVSGIAAALVAMLMSYFGVVSEATVRAIILLLCALLLLRDLRNDVRAALVADNIDLMRHHLRDVVEAVGGTDIVVISPLRMRQEFQDFAAQLHGDVTWYNVCCRMFRRQDVFDTTLRQLVDNPDITAIHMLCSQQERVAWDADVVPKLRRYGGQCKVRPPLWGSMPPAISFLIGECRSDQNPKVLLAILEEPFATAVKGISVPSYVLRIANHSELLGKLDQLARTAASTFEQDEADRVERVIREKQAS